MSLAPSQLIGIFALAMLAIGVAAVLESVLLSLEDTTATRWSRARRRTFAVHALETSITFVMTPIIAVVALVFLATLAPAFLLLPLFVIWASQAGEAPLRQVTRS